MSESDHEQLLSAGLVRRREDSEEFQPYVPHDETQKEITVRAVLLSLVLAVILGSANVYLGLFAGMTVSASIPAAIISMSVLRTLFKDVSILENNLVQTAASAGEALAAGVIFTFPAILVMHNDKDNDLKTWGSFPYVTVAILSVCGGVLGIMFSIPIRRAMIIEIKPALAFPEGVACANVLKAGQGGGTSAITVAKAAVGGAIVKLLTQMNLSADTIGFGFFIKKAVFRAEMSISAALVGVGYIIGWKIAAVFVLGGFCNWLIAIPISTGSGLITVGQSGDPSSEDAAYKAWSHETRFLGVGAMLTGGIWALISLRQALWAGISAGIAAFKAATDATANGTSVRRTDLDMPLHYCLVIVGVCMIPFYIIISIHMEDWGFTIFLTAVVLVFGFFASVIAAYMAGLVGSSNNPIGGVTVSVLLITSLLLRAYLGTHSKVGPPAAIFVAAMAACAGSISGDNMQDLKTGHVLGATPWKQQIMLIVGVAVSALFMPPVLNLLNEAYGFGPDAGDNALPAPQASLMASVATGVIQGGLPWGFVGAGAGVAVIVITIDQMLKRYGIPFALPVLGFAVGFYLPFATGVPIMMGALVGLAAGADPSDEASEGVLFAGGLISGEALMGIMLAIPIVISGDSGVLHVISDPLWYTAIPIMLAVLAWVYYVSKGDATPARKHTTEWEAIES